MRYKIKGIEIRSENAAKPVGNASSALVEWLHNREYTFSALDFGCGKLRYTHHLAKKSDILGVVDSRVQLSRTQRICGENISVCEYLEKKLPKCRVHVLEQFWLAPVPCYDFILCSNVLSTIPCPKARDKSLLSISSALCDSGQVLFVNQHSNSYFTKAKEKENAFLYLDGWISMSKTGASYYGILNKNAVIDIIAGYGFAIRDAWVQGQSNYVLATKEKK